MDNTQKDIWNKVAPSVNFTLNIDYQAFQKFVPLEASVLDFGCGYGRVTNDLFELRYKNITGIDTAADMVLRGKADYPHLNLSDYDAPIIPADDNQYDAIMCCAVLTCIPGSKAQKLVIRELKRVLKKSGMIYFAEFLQTANKTYSEDGTFKTGFGAHMKHFKRQELLDLVKDFQVLSVAERVEKSISGNEASSLQFVVQND